MKQLFLLFCSAAVLLHSNAADNKGVPQLQPAVFALSMVMMHDVVSPPAASRYYAYCMLGAYDITARQQLPGGIPAKAFLRDYPSIAIGTASYDAEAAAVYCVLETGRLMLPSGYLLQEKEDAYVALLKQQLTDSVIARSIRVATEVAAQVIAFSKKDHYSQLSAKLRYTPLRGEGHWYPTPPMYMEAVEPNWKTIRPLLLDSCNEFVPRQPVAFSKDSASVFYQLAKEVYTVSRNPTVEQLAIAAFWDCNPFAVATSGHLSIGYKKISPGGHWMNIAAIAAGKAQLDFASFVCLLTAEAVTQMDAFISCWDEKYRSNRIRPETYINRYIDIRWQPLLQTPPFPEYTSGHSVVSAASAEVLTYFLGADFTYTDDSEQLFEISPRSFRSFRQAAAEAAISRLYGGIHYRDAIENGEWQGIAVAKKIIGKMQQAGLRPFAKALAGR